MIMSKPCATVQHFSTSTLEPERGAMRKSARCMVVILPPNELARSHLHV